MTVPATVTGDIAPASRNGEITVANKAALDYETTPQFILTVQVEDSYGETDDATITIDLNDISATVYTVTTTADSGAGSLRQAILDGDVGYHVREGGHSVERYDWQRFLDFADRHLKR